MCFPGVLPLTVQFITDEPIEVILRNIFEMLRALSARVWRGLQHEPLKDFFKSILTPLLVCDIVAESWLLVKLSERVRGLLEADFKAIQVHIRPIHARCLWRLMYRTLVKPLPWRSGCTSGPNTTSDESWGRVCPWREHGSCHWWLIIRLALVLLLLHLGPSEAMLVCPLVVLSVPLSGLPSLVIIWVVVGVALHFWRLNDFFRSTSVSLRDLIIVSLMLADFIYWVINRYNYCLWSLFPI